MACGEGWKRRAGSQCLLLPRGGKGRQGAEASTEAHQVVGGAAGGEVVALHQLPQPLMAVAVDHHLMRLGAGLNPLPPLDQSHGH